MSCLRGDLHQFLLLLLSAAGESEKDEKTHCRANAP